MIPRAPVKSLATEKYHHEVDGGFRTAQSTSALMNRGSFRHHHPCG